MWIYIYQERSKPKTGKTRSLRTNSWIDIALKNSRIHLRLTLPEGVKKFTATDTLLNHIIMQISDFHILKSKKKKQIENCDMNRSSLLAYFSILLSAKDPSVMLEQTRYCFYQVSICEECWYILSASDLNEIWKKYTN